MTAGTAIDRAELRDHAREVLDDVASSASVRALLESETGFDEKLWTQLRDVGWLGMEVPDELGGGGAAFGDVATVLVELGAHLTLSPVASSMVLGVGAAALSSARTDLLPAIADGGTRVTAGLHGSGHIESGALSGRWTHVPDARTADVVALRIGADLALVPADGLTILETPMVDRTRRFGSVEAAGVPVADVVPGGAEALADRAALGTACDALGVAERALATTTTYLTQRVQFGRPVGSFQALKHECADMLIAVETARVALRQGLAAYDEDPRGGALAVSVAKALVVDHAVSVAEHAMTLHGGIGFTWEHDCHLMLKRVTLSQHLDGSSHRHRRRAGRLLLGRS